MGREPEHRCGDHNLRTGVTGRDVTPEAFERVCEKDIPGFGELFRWISFQKIGTSTIQSRAVAGVAKGTYLFACRVRPGFVRTAGTKSYTTNWTADFDPAISSS